MGSIILNNVLRMTRTKSIQYQNIRQCAEVPVNPLRDMYSANNQVDNGRPYADKPFKIRLIAGKTYGWCLCGYSHSQPFCDKEHRNIFMKIKLRPIIFTVPKTGSYWLCQCKQTKNRPFCDGSHRAIQESAQEKLRTDK